MDNYVLLCGENHRFLPNYVRRVREFKHYSILSSFMLLSAHTQLEQKPQVG